MPDETEQTVADEALTPETEPELPSEPEPVPAPPTLEGLRAAVDAVQAEIAEQRAESDRLLAETVRIERVLDGMQPPVDPPPIEPPPPAMRRWWLELGGPSLS